jgi:hypothetical protein
MYVNGLEPTNATQHELDDDHEIQKLTEELRRMDDEEKWLDDTINSVENQLSEMSKDPLYDQFAYVSYEDIKRLTQDKENSNWTLLAIRAPKGTTLEIPDTQADSAQNSASQSMSQSESSNDIRLTNQIFLNSPKDEIMVYMINNDNSAASEVSGDLQNIKQEQLSEVPDEKEDNNDKTMVDVEKDKAILWDEENLDEDLEQHGDQNGNSMFDMFTDTITFPSI